MDGTYPVEYDVDYPDRPLNRLTSAFRIFNSSLSVTVRCASRWKLSFGGWSTGTAR